MPKTQAVCFRMLPPFTRTQQTTIRNSIGPAESKVGQLFCPPGLCHVHTFGIRSHTYVKDTSSVLSNASTFHSQARNNNSKLSWTAESKVGQLFCPPGLCHVHTFGIRSHTYAKDTSSVLSNASSFHSQARNNNSKLNWTAESKVGQLFCPPGLSHVHTFGIRSHTYAKDTSSVLLNASTFHSQARNNNSKLSWTSESKVGQLFCPPGVCHVHTFGIRSHTYAKETSSLLSNASTFHSQARNNNSKLSWTAESKVGQLFRPLGVCHVHTFGIRSHTYAKDTSSVPSNASTFHSQARNNNSKLSWTAESKVGQLFCPPGVCHVHTFGIRSHTYAKDTSTLLSNACTFHSQATNNNWKLSWTAESKVGQLLCPPGLCHVDTFGIRSHTYAKDTSSLLSNACTFHSQARNNYSKLSWTAESKVGQLFRPLGVCHVHTLGIRSHTYAKDTSSVPSNASTFHSQARNNNWKLSWTAESKVGQLFCPPGLCYVHTFGIWSHTYAKDTSSVLSNASTFHSQARNNNSKLNWTAESKVGQLFCPPGLCHVHTFGIRSHTYAKDTSTLLSNACTFHSQATNNNWKLSWTAESKVGQLFCPPGLCHVDIFGIRSHTYAKDTSSLLSNACTFHSHARNNNSKLSWTAESKVGQLFCPPGLCHVHTFGIRSHTYAKDTSSVLSNTSTFHSQARNNNSKLNWTAESKVGQLFCPPSLCHVHTFRIRTHTYAKDTSTLLSNASTFHSQVTNNNSKLSWTVESKVGQLFCPPGLCHVHTFGIWSHTYAKDTSSVLSNASTFHSQARNNHLILNWTAESKVGQLFCPPGLCHVHTFGIRSHTNAKDTSSVPSNASTFHSQARNNNSKLSWTAESKVGQLFCPPGLCHVHTFGIRSHTYAKDTSSLLSNACTFHSQATNNNSKLNWTAESKVGQLFCPPGLCHVHTFGIRSHTYAKDTSSVPSNASTFHSQARNNDSKLSWTAESKVGQLFCPPGVCHFHTFGIRSHTYAKDTSSVLSNACTFHSQARNNNSKLSWTVESKVGQLFCPPGVCHVHTFGIRSHTCAKDTSSVLSNTSTFHSQARNNNSKLNWTAESKVGQLFCPPGLCRVHTFRIRKHTYAKDTSSLLSNACTFHSQARNNSSKLSWTAESKVGQLFCPPGLCHVHTFGIRSHTYAKDTSTLLSNACTFHSQARNNNLKLRVAEDS